MVYVIPTSLYSFYRAMHFSAKHGLAIACRLSVSLCLPPSWKILNGCFCATGDPIHFMFGSRVGFAGSADRMALFPVTSNPSWR